MKLSVISWKTVIFGSALFALTGCNMENRAAPSAADSSDSDGLPISTTGQVAIVTTVVQIGSFSASVADDQSILFSIASLPSGTASVKITTASTLSGATGANVGPTPSFLANALFPQLVSGFHPGMQIDVQAHALDANGIEIVASSILSLQMTGNLNVTWPPVVVPPAPTAPSNLAVVSSSTSTVSLSWADNSNNEDGFHLERKLAASGTYAEVQILTSNHIGATDALLSPASTYIYRIRAVNAGGYSAYSNEIQATTQALPVTAPAAPSSLSFSSVTTNSVSLAWNDNSSNEDSFRVERKLGASGTYSEIKSLSANSAGLNDTGLTASSIYFYRVRAVNVGGASAYSNEVQVATAAVVVVVNPPAAPSSLVASAITSSSVNLSWKDNSSNEDSIRVERKLSAAGTYVEIKSLSANSVALSDTGLAASSTYFYRVRAVNTGGASAYSTEVQVNTNAIIVTTMGTFTAVVTDNQTLKFSIASLPTASASVKLTSISTVGRETGDKVGPTNVSFPTATVWPQSIAGFHPGWQIDVQAHALNSAGVEIVASPVVTVTMPGDSDITWPIPLAPAAPSGLVAGNATSSGVALSWLDNSSNEDSFKIERKLTASGTYAEVNSALANAINFTDTGLNSSSIYLYRIRAYNAGGYSAYSNEVSVTTAVAPLLTVTGFTALPLGTDNQSVKFSIASLPTGTANVKLLCSSTTIGQTGDDVCPIKTLPVSTTWPQTIAGFHPGWQLNVQAQALDSSSKVLASSQVITLSMSGDSSTCWPATSSTCSGSTGGGGTTTTTSGGTITAQGTSYNVQAYGVQGAIDRAQNGDTVVFPVGNYSVSSQINIYKSVLLLGPTDGTAKIVGSRNVAFDVATNKVTIANLTFSNAEVKFETASDLVVDNNIFLNYLGLPDAPLAMRGHVTNMKISNNQFGDPSNASAQSGFSIYSDGAYDNLTIKNNEMYNACGFHVDAHGDTDSIGNGIYVKGHFGSTKMLAEQNYFNGTKGCPMLEFQGAANSVIVQDNWAENPQLSNIFNNNNDAIGYSLPLNGSDGVIIQRNITLETNRFDGTGVRYGFELGGVNTLVQQNYVSGINAAFADTDGVTVNGLVTVQNNYMNNVLQGPNISFPNDGRRLVASNNNASVSIGTVFSRGRPHRNQRYTAGQLQ